MSALVMAVEAVACLAMIGVCGWATVVLSWFTIQDRRRGGGYAWTVPLGGAIFAAILGLVYVSSLVGVLT